jgi:predicted nucleic acid-binding protein
MILVDTSVWIDHLRRGEPTLAALLRDGQVLCHPAVVGEVGLGSLARPDEILRLLANLPKATLATHTEVMMFIDNHKLFGRGIGYVDAHLLAATVLAGDAALWSRDQPLRAAAQAAGCAADLGD